MPLREWRRLMHVCRKWRQIIFESPRHLNLQILCTGGTLFKKSLGIWPDFPIAINYRGPSRLTSAMEDDVIAALEHRDRVCHIELDITGSQLEKIATVLHKPFPVLTHLDIGSRGVIHGGAPVLTSGFLGGSAPCLEEITLNLISFPALLPFLSSARNLIKLTLYKVPPAGYISPDALVACLADLPRLDTLCFDFELAGVRLGQMHPPPMTRTILPALTHFHCLGANKYLEDLVAQIDCPELERISASYIDSVDDFQVAQLSKFINRSVGPSISPFVPTTVRLYNGGSVLIDMYCHPKGESWDPATITIYYRDTERQISYIAPALKRFSLGFSAILSIVACLSLVAEDRPLEGTGDVDWLHLLRRFSAVQALHVSLELAGHVALELEAIPADRVAEVLPSLSLIYLESQPTSSLEKFVAARALSDRPIIVVDDRLGFDEILKSKFVLGLEGITE
jgi:hypothetical protein